MWHLIRINLKKDTEKAMEALKVSQLTFLSVSSLMEHHHSQAAIINLLHKTSINSYLFIYDDHKKKVQTFLNTYKTLFTRVRCKIEKNGHIVLNQEEFDQFILTLQIPEKYNVIEVNELPKNEGLKKITLPYGPLQGMKGKYLDTKTPGGKRFYLPVLSLFYIEIRIPIKDIKSTQKQLSIHVNYLTDNLNPQWYLLSCMKKEYIQQLIGNTLNKWQPETDTPTLTTHLKNPTTGQTIETVRFLYEAIYTKQTEQGEKEVNLMPHYFFFKTNRYDLETFRGNDFNTHIYIMRKSDGTPITIPEYQIKLFANFLKKRSEATEALYEDYQKGDTARIAMGIEKDNEIKGVVHVVTQNHYILVSENGFKVNVRKRKR